MIKQLSAMAGLSPDEFAILLVVIIQIPLSFLYRSIPLSPVDNHSHRKIFGMVVGLVCDLYLFGVSGMIFAILSLLVFYKLTDWCTSPLNTIKVNFLAFSFLCVCNIYRLIIDYEGNTNNVMLLLMMTVPKQIYFNWHVYNMRKENKTDIPSIFDYFCYVLNFIGTLVTPLYSYQEFDNFIRQAFPEHKPNTSKIIQKLMWAVGSIIVIFLSNIYFDYKLVDTPMFREMSLMHQIIHISIHGILIRTKYCCIWHLSEIPAIVCNVRSLDLDNRSYVRSISVKGVEFYNSPKYRIERWNISVAEWLKNCFYLPFVNYLKMDTHKASMLTFIVSAFWHGFYPTYYIVFFAFNIVSTTEKLMFKGGEIFKYFPSLYFRLMFDINGILFKRVIISEWIECFKNLWPYFMSIFVVYFATKVIIKFNKKPRGPNEMKKQKTK